MQMLRGLLEQTRPFIQVVALALAAMAAWNMAGEIIPILKQVFAFRVDAQKMAIVAAALALVAGK